MFDFKTNYWIGFESKRRIPWSNDEGCFPIDVLTPLPKSVLIPLGLTGAASAIDSAIEKKIYVIGITTRIISI